MENKTYNNIAGNKKHNIQKWDKVIDNLVSLDSVDFSVEFKLPESILCQSRTVTTFDFKNSIGVFEDDTDLLKVLTSYENDGWLTSTKHETLPLTIWNYTENTQYERHWDNITLNCRSIVTENETGKIIASSFPKFFNWEEPNFDKPLGEEPLSIQNKVDGSFIMIFMYQDEWIVMSKGSFYSPQAVWANEIFEKDNDIKGVLINEKYSEVYSHCFELIHPENRIVVDYGDKKELVYLTSYYSHLGEKEFPFKNKVESYDFGFDYDSLKNNQFENKEGYVVKFKDRWCKIKFEDYKRLHYIITSATTYTVYDALKDGGARGLKEILDNIPDEFYGWVQETRHKIQTDYYAIKSEAYSEFMRINEFGVMTDKEYSELVNKEIRKDLVPLMYCLRNGNEKGFNKIAWNRAKPEFRKAFQ